MAANSTRRLDVIAQYWQLLASPDDSRSGDYGYTQDQMHKFGAHQGAAVYQALDDAADRNVNIRCVSILLISLMVIVKLELNREHFD
jgi:phospholipase D3/4